MRPQRWIYKLSLRLRSLFHRREADRELDDELRYHLEEKTQQYIAQGQAPQEARRAALLEMGGLEKRKEECRDARRITWLQDLLQDIRYGLRMPRQIPRLHHRRRPHPCPRHRRQHHHIQRSERSDVPQTSRA